MNAYKSFLKANGLKQVELALFLEVTESAVSNVVRGKANLSEEKLIKILQNDQGWDTSMLVGLSSRNYSVGNNSSGVIVNGNNSNSPIDNRHYYSDSPDVLRAQIDLLDERIREKEERLKEKDAQIKEKDAQIKEKDAQIKQLLDIIQGMKK